MSKLNGSKNEKLSNEEHEADTSGYRGALILDVEKYLEYLKEFSLSDEAKNEVVRTLRDMVQEFVDIAWGDTGVQTAMATSEPSSKDNPVDEERNVTRITTAACKPDCQD